ncbi:hypothetical protein [Azonexus sp.]
MSKQMLADKLERWPGRWLISYASKPGMNPDGSDESGEQQGGQKISAARM